MSKVNPSRFYRRIAHLAAASQRLFSRRWSATKALLGTGFMLCALTACSLPQEINGSSPDPENVAQVQPGKSTRADVTRLMGTPSSKSSFDPNIWYYASRRVGRDTLGDTSLLEQRVYVATFDTKGTLTDFELHVNDAHDVSMIARATPAPGKELSFIEQVLGNFGKFGGNKKKSKDDEDTGS